MHFGRWATDVTCVSSLFPRTKEFLWYSSFLAIEGNVYVSLYSLYFCRNLYMFDTHTYTKQYNTKYCTRNCVVVTSWFQFNIIQKYQLMCYCSAFMYHPHCAAQLIYKIIIGGNMIALLWKRFVINPCQQMHVSFSLSGGGPQAQNQSLPPVLNVLMQSLGVTLTDIQDVVFKWVFCINTSNDLVTLSNQN